MHLRQGVIAAAIHLSPSPVILSISCAHGPLSILRGSWVYIVGDSIIIRPYYFLYPPARTSSCSPRPSLPPQWPLFLNLNPSTSQSEKPAQSFKAEPHGALSNGPTTPKRHDSGRRLTSRGRVPGNPKRGRQRRGRCRSSHVVDTPQLEDDERNTTPRPRAYGPGQPQ